MPTKTRETARMVIKKVVEELESKLRNPLRQACLLYTSDAADERSSVDLGGRRIIKKKKKTSIKRVHA